MKKTLGHVHVFWNAWMYLDQPSRSRSADLCNGATFLLIWSEGSKAQIQNQAPHARVQGCLLPLRYKPSGCVCENVEQLQRKMCWPAGKDWLFITLHGQSMRSMCQHAEFRVTDPRAVHRSSCQVTLGWREGGSPLEVKCFKENKNKKATTMTKQTIGVSDGNSLISFVCVNYKWGGKACLNSQILFPFPPRQIFPSSLERGTTIRLNSQHWNVDREDVFHLQVWPIDLFSCNPLFPIPFSIPFSCFLFFMKRILKFSFHKREGALVPSWSPRLEASLTYGVSEEWTSMVKLLRYGGLSVTGASPTYPN